MNKKIIILGLFLCTLIATSCVKDLDVKPKDANTILSGNLTQSQYGQVLGKIYASFIISGQGANGGDDIVASDGNFFTTMRALWNVQEITTDEAICAWGDVGIADLNTQTWTPTNPFLTALFQRLSLSITYANDFIKLTNGNTDEKIARYNAEARFLRALAYYYAIDLFGQFPFTTEADGVGKFFPVVKDRAAIFSYVKKELLDIENKLGEPGFSYPQADKACAWMLLAKLFLNSKVYIGKDGWDSCKVYCDKVVDCKKYSLAADYRQNFSADNDGKSNPEMIFAWEEDGINTQGYIGVTFLIESSCDAKYIPAPIYTGLTSNTNWNGNRTKKEFINVLVDTIATYGKVPVPAADTIFAKCPDKRVFCHTKKSWDIPSPSSSGDYGIGVYKFTARKANGELPANYNSAFVCTDYPVFRYADALLMRAEAQYRLGKKAEAVVDVNKVRTRANASSITEADLNDKFLLSERGREFYYEGQRRTDLIRFGQFTDGDYTWTWKGGTFKGTKTDNHLNLFPIPAAEISANPNYKGQNNPGY